ncbi:hypothetical protein AAJCM20276_17290 [Acetobacter aceti]|uniref:Uncharacterized protein n=1 Tax=Acetobacter aceti TaxID=435 RepID=A0A6S6PK91_ACEAC|nr:hypothetical protein AAJCM20276_17290 [Acetobacter aceti]
MSGLRFSFTTQSCDVRFGTELSPHETGARAMVTRIARFVSNGLIAVLVASKDEAGIPMTATAKSQQKPF